MKVERYGFRRWPWRTFRFGRAFYQDRFQNKASWHYSVILFGCGFWWVMAP